ncbi:MAG: hypothetical protein NW208_13785 [Bryobacter sp.]|nr:hypothetical protein [Bryobacter sp.]
MNKALTLGEAIERLRREEDPDGQTVAAMAGDLAAAFDMHDTVHILFGCDTSIEGEIAAHVWMKFGTTCKISEMHRAVASNEHRRVLAGIGHFKLLRIWSRMVPRILAIIGRACRMKKRVSFEQLPMLKLKTIAAIQAEHGISA